MIVTLAIESPLECKIQTSQSKEQPLIFSEGLLMLTLVSNILATMCGPDQAEKDLDTRKRFKAKREGNKLEDRWLDSNTPLPMDMN